MNRIQAVFDAAVKALFLSMEALGAEVLLVKGQAKGGVTNSAIGIVYDNPVHAAKLEAFMEELANSDTELTDRASFTSTREGISEIEHFPAPTKVPAITDVN